MQIPADSVERTFPKFAAFARQDRERIAYSNLHMIAFAGGDIDRQPLLARHSS